jgi:ATP-dependent DNA helicase RecQ
MELTIHQILLKYWGYSAFRPLQEEIIRSVMEGSDTLALLPTGGGKSICYQVPAMTREGICLVISPLIALMKDQVENLKKRGIPAAAVYSGMHRNEIGRVISNCRYGATKLLYISPERLTTEFMREAVRQMKINLLAVDEAHCISQWGYDFRPPYLEITNIRPLLPKVPVLALTATATPKVVLDIRQKLGFKNENLFQKSFERKNLTYYVIREEDKMNRLLRIVNKVKGPGIVYVRNRRQTKEIADFLKKNRISADHYHAGLDPRVRDQRQIAWIREDKRIIVATNAFGMGIDKPNVRFVVHMDIPDSIEAYFQEAGRGGRDEKAAFAVLLYEKADILDARHNIGMAYPEIKVIRDVYQALGNYFQVPVGAGRDLQFDFDLAHFSDQYRFQHVVAFNALKLLEKEGFILLTDAFFNPSKLFIRAGKEELYRFQVENASLDHFIKTILRSYGGILSDFVKISESELARRTGISEEQAIRNLMFMVKIGLVDYVRQTDKPQLIFVRERVNINDISLSPENYKLRQKEAVERIEAMIGYVESTNRCRSQALLAYFGDVKSRRCGKCDVCLERNKVSLNQVEFDRIVETIKPVLKLKSCTMDEIIATAGSIQDEKVLRAIQWLVDNDKIRIEPGGKYRWIPK